MYHHGQLNQQGGSDECPEKSKISIIAASLEEKERIMNYMRSPELDEVLEEVRADKKFNEANPTSTEIRYENDCGFFTGVHSDSYPGESTGTDYNLYEDLKNQGFSFDLIEIIEPGDEDDEPFEIYPFSLQYNNKPVMEVDVYVEELQNEFISVIAEMIRNPTKRKELEKGLDADRRALVDNIFEVIEEVIADSKPELDLDSMAEYPHLESDIIGEAIGNYSDLRDDLVQIALKQSKELAALYQKAEELKYAEKHIATQTLNRLKANEPGKIMSTWDQLCQDLSNENNLQELRGMAKTLGIKGYSKLNKAELCDRVATFLVIMNKTGAHPANLVPLELV